jgi:hypothetical protein
MTGPFMVAQSVDAQLIVYNTAAPLTFYLSTSNAKSPSPLTPVYTKGEGLGRGCSRSVNKECLTRYMLVHKDVRYKIKWREGNERGSVTLGRIERILDIV